MLLKNFLIEEIASELYNKKSIIFIGRGEQYPIAIEGALKLKKISYIHTKAYPAGELKYGLLAIIDKKIPIIVLASNNALLKKIPKNIKEICSRNGQVYVFSDQKCAGQKI